MRDDLRCMGEVGTHTVCQCPGKPAIAWDDPKAAEALAQLALVAGPCTDEIGASR
jgi:hypothetical protein